MGWFSRLVGVPEPFTPAATADQGGKGEEARSVLSLDDPALLALFGYPGIPGVGNVSPNTAMTVSAVYRSVSLISGTIGTLPLRTLQRGPGDTNARSNSFLDNPGNMWLTPYEWQELVTVYLLLHGAAPLLHVYNGANQLAGLQPIHPTAVTVDADSDAFGGRRFTVTLDDGTRREFDASSMTYIPALSLDGVRGISPITFARMSLGTALAGDKAAYRLFSSGAMVAGLVTPEDDLTEEEARVVKDHVNKALTGPENAGDIAVINRKLKFQPWTMTAADAEFLASRNFSIDEVGRWFGLPPHLLGLTEKSTSWGQGIAEQNRGLARYTLRPWTARIEQRVSRLLVPGKWAEFDYSAFIQPAPEDEIGLLINQVNSGLLTLNEARRIRNMPPLPPDTGADLPRIPAGAGTPRQQDEEEDPSPPGRQRERGEA